MLAAPGMRAVCHPAATGMGQGRTALPLLPPVGHPWDGLGIDASNMPHPHMAKIDLRATYKHLYSPTAGRVSVVDLPELSFTTIDGSVVWGVSPGEAEEFQQAVQAMYGVAYTVKFMSKMRSPDPVDFSVMALEGF